jgi:hypothetical protein
VAPVAGISRVAVSLRRCFLASFLTACASRAPAQPPLPSLVVAVASPDAASVPDAPDAEPAASAPSSDAAAPSPDVAVDAAPSPFAGETITAVIREVAIYFGPRVAPEWRGYLRAGGTARIVRGPLGDEQCPARPDRRDTGWYEIEGGGYICASRGAVLTRHLTRDMRSRLASQPALDAGLPYRYGHAPRAAIVYRSLPTTAEEQATEPERFVTPIGEAGLENSAVVRLAGDMAPTLADLEGREDTPILRRLTRGMYVSIDRGARAESGAIFHRTHSGGWVRATALQGVGSRPFHGLALTADGARLPVAFVTAENATLRRLGPDNIMRQLIRTPRLTGHPLESAEPVRWRTEDFLRTRDGRYLRRADVTVVTAQPPPADLIGDEKWIDVNLDRQSLVAYVGATPVYATLVSTGLTARDDTGASYETVQGGFRIQQKHIATTMDGDATNGAYSIEDVPWVMYFEQSFALHGAYWHTGFGAVRSHGCVNLLPEDARWLFAWTSPTVPAGWHGAFSTTADPGTRVYVHYDRQSLGERGGPAVVPGH